MSEKLERSKDILDGLLGFKVFDVKLGHGSFITMDFGMPIEVQVETSKGSRVFVRGEWHLWVYMCAWRIDRGGCPLVGSEDSREKISQKIIELMNKKIVSYNIDNKSLDADFCFEDDVVLHLFPTNTEEDEHWMIYTPDFNVLTAGPKSDWRYEPYT